MSQSKDALLKDVDASWQELLDFIESLTETQITQPTDAAGWTVKDHIIHIAVWEYASLAMLEGKSKRETLEISPEVWEQDDDPVNAVLQARYHHLPFAEVMQTLRQNHENMLKKLNSFSEADLQLPYKHYQPQSDSDRPIIDFIGWDTVHHYRQHIPWMAAIAQNA